MSVSDPAVSADCDTPEELSIQQLAEQVKDASIHLEVYHPRTKAEPDLTSLIRTIAYYTLCYGDNNPEGWRGQIIPVLAAQYYKAGCCTWRG